MSKPVRVGVGWGRTGFRPVSCCFFCGQVGNLSYPPFGLAAADYLPITIWVGDCQEYPDFGEDDQGAIDQINRLLDRRADGLILWPSFAVAYYEHYRELMHQGIPVVVIDHKLADDGSADSIETDEEQGTRWVAEHSLDLGHHRIACFSAREIDWQAWSIRRRQLFELAISDLIVRESTAPASRIDSSSRLIVAGG